MPAKDGGADPGHGLSHLDLDNSATFRFDFHSQEISRNLIDLKVFEINVRPVLEPSISQVHIARRQLSEKFK